MSIQRNLADILSEHTTLEVESSGRMDLHLYAPIVQREAGTGEVQDVLKTAMDRISSAG